MATQRALLLYQCMVNDGLLPYKPVHVNATALIRAYPGLLREEDVVVFVAALQQLCSGLASLMTMEKLKTLCLDIE